MRPVVVFELNEVPWSVLDWWVAEQPRSAIAELVTVADQVTTVAPDEGHLSPWVTWPTVHRGVPNTVHGIGHFGQDTTDADRVAPPWWQSATEAGRRVGIFGLLHTDGLPDDVDRYAFYVPDTFAPTTATHPASLEPFQAFNLAMARESARNVSTAIDRRTAAAFLARAPRLGLRASTLARVAGQLVAERRSPHVRVRRRSFQSVIAFDLFDRLLRTTRPDAAAFFTNHVASAMHRYWAATFPDHYDPSSFEFDDTWVERWKGELGIAMGHADRMVERLVSRCATTGATLLVASSMGQEALLGHPVGRQLYLRDLDRFVAAAGIDPTDVERRPAMDPHVNVRVADAAVSRFRDHVEALSIGGVGIDWSEEEGGFFSLAFGQADERIDPIEVAGERREPADLGFEIVEIEDEVASTGYHKPDGSLIVFDPTSTARPDRSRQEIPTTEIAAMILGRLGVDGPVRASRAT